MPGPMGRPGGKMETEKPKNFKETTKKLINGYLSKYKLALIIVFIFAIGSTIFTIVGPKILGNATTEIFNGLIGKLSGGNGIDFGKIRKGYWRTKVNSHFIFYKIKKEIEIIRILHEMMDIESHL